LSLRDLERAGLILPKEQWGRHDMQSKVNRASLAAAWIMAGVSAVLMYAGNGLALTWVGLAGMLAFMAWFTYLSIQAINKRNREESELWDKPEDENNGDEVAASGSR